MKVIDGELFACNRCGRCCKWNGVVILTPSDIERISKFLNLSEERFIDLYTKICKGKRVLIDKLDSSECIFLKDNECTIWDCKPEQCEKFPTKYDDQCPGFLINRSGSKMSKYEKIVKTVKEKLFGTDYERKLVDNIFKKLKKNIKSASVMNVSQNSIDKFLNSSKNVIKISSLEDLFLFERVGIKNLIHKCTKELWTIDSDKDGNILIKRLFNDNGEPIKG